jgi:hypothetical protein
MKPEARSQLEAAIKTTGEEEEHYRQEKKEIEQAAKKLEAERDVNRDKDPCFDYAEVLLQIAIVLASISILAGSPLMFYFSPGTAIPGTLLSINGFFLIVHIPFL